MAIGLRTFGAQFRLILLTSSINTTSLSESFLTMTVWVDKGCLESPSDSPGVDTNKEISYSPGKTSLKTNVPFGWTLA
jgi:hypothetical protein